MPYSRDTLSQLQSAVDQDISGALRGSDPLLRFSNLRILGRIAAGLANLHYGFLDWISRMAVPFTAEDEYLLGWGGLKGVVLKQATKAGDNNAGAVTFSSNVDTVIPAGVPLVRGDGVTFTSTIDTPIGANATAAVFAIADAAGADGNTPVNALMTLGVQIVGVNSNGTVTTAFTGGADAEMMDDYRSRMLEVYQNTPQGGAVADYRKWALEVPGVTRAWVLPNGMGGGTVIVYIMLDDAEAAHGGFPQGSDGVATDEDRAATATGDQLTVANYIYGDDETARQPVTALVYVVAPVPNVINFTIKNIAAVSAGIKAQIAAAISGVFVEFGAPGGTIDLSDIESAIASIPGTEGFVITVPADNIVNPTGNLPTLGVVTYV